MFRLQSTIYKSYLLVIAAALVAAVSGTCQAFDRASVKNNSVFSVKQSKLRAELIPIRMMTDDQLFLSVIAERDQSMSQEHQRINYSWLVNYRSRDYSGSAAIRNVARTAFYSIRPYFEQEPNTLATSYKSEKMVFTDINNYRLRLSNDKMLLGFKYQF